MHSQAQYPVNWATWGLYSSSTYVSETKYETLQNNFATDITYTHVLLLIWTIVFIYMQITISFQEQSQASLVIWKNYVCWI